ncbi:MAG: bifunctional precorrin-2 dehydrogenase/sirohydrochlorin ferrochelatase [Candidatus Omnitrophota bacterium]|nr:bifunctional precorrin-2 dehydrogenase/sirohydrochlorin ferrochelatase [Candidatus Omnitrophota bacterium]
MKYYPLALEVKNRRVLVVGAGAVAERKIKNLLKFGARIQVVAPLATAKIRRLAGEGRISWLKREFAAQDLKGSQLVIAAASNEKINKQVSKEAAKKKVLINVVDNPALSDFISPAVFSSKQAIIAVFTEGRNPVLSRDLKNFLKGHWDEFLSYRNRLQHS